MFTPTNVLTHSLLSFTYLLQPHTFPSISAFFLLFKTKKKKEIVMADYLNGYDTPRLVHALREKYTTLSRDLKEINEVSDPHLKEQMIEEKQIENQRESIDQYLTALRARDERSVLAAVNAENARVELKFDVHNQTVARGMEIFKSVLKCETLFQTTKYLKVVTGIGGGPTEIQHAIQCYCDIGRIKCRAWEAGVLTVTVPLPH